MFNFFNLSDSEFEVLCKDIMQRKLNVDLYTFSRGIDGGIDICDKNISPDIVIQAKHYINSKFPQLKTKLKDELTKVKKLNPKNYYICTTIALRKEHKNEIVKMFSNWMTDTSFVIDKIDLNDFLQNNDNKDIVYRHYKLWFCTTEILSFLNNQHVFIDCEELMEDIKNSINIFVNTTSFFEAKNKLEKSKIIIITGAPGVGKTTISNMLLLSYAKNGYRVRYASNNDITDIKKALSLDAKTKEIILLDDFLGQHYLKIKESQPNELKALISFVQKSTNKLIILNSRITIINEAFQSSLVFRRLMENNESNKYLIDLNKMNYIERAKILYNHLYFSEIPVSYFLNIKQDKNYEKIIRHRNYNPRIIEFVTRKSNYNRVKPEEFIGFILDKLENPEDVWHDEFRNRLSESDRIFMYTLYSLSDDIIDKTKLEISFNKRILTRKEVNTSINLFNDTLARLSDSLIRIIDKNKTLHIGVINPSVNDYMKSELFKNPIEQRKIIEAAAFFEQIERVAVSVESETLLKSLINNSCNFEIMTLNNSVSYYYLKTITKYNILSKSLMKNVTESLKKIHQNIVYFEKKEYSNLILDLFSEIYREFYELNIIFNEPYIMSNMLEPMTLDDSKALFDLYVDNMKTINENILEVFRDAIIKKIYEKANNDIDEVLGDKVKYIIEGEDFDYIHRNLKYYISKIEECLYESIFEIIDDEYSDLIDLLKDSDFDITEDYKLPLIDITGAIDSAIDEIIEDLNQSVDNYKEDYKCENQSSIIKAIFER